MAVFSAKSKRQDLKSKGQFHTNEALSALTKKKILEVGTPLEVLDICVGSGGLLIPFENATYKGLDIEHDFVEFCKENYNQQGNEFYLTSCFADNPFRKRKWDYIVANPPFSIRDKEIIKQNEARFKEVLNYPYPLPSVLDCHFILENLALLSEKGVCVCLMGKGFGYRGNKELLARKFLIENNFIESIESVEKSYFDDTSVFVDCYVFKKNLNTQGITFIRDNKSLFVSNAELEKNDFNLSVNFYIPDNKQEEAVDIDKINKQVVCDFLAEVEAYLKGQKILSETFGISTYSDSLSGIKRIIDNEARLFVP